MGCKIPLKVSIEFLGEHILLICNAYLHPKGCMKANQTHIDINLMSTYSNNELVKALIDLIKVRGTKVTCFMNNGVIILDLRRYGLGEVAIRVLGSRDVASIACYRAVYLMVTRSGYLYVGPLRIAEGSG